MNFQEQTRRLKLYVFLDRKRIDAWKWSLIQDLLKCNFLAVCFVELKPSTLRSVKSLWTGVNAAPFRLYEQADQWIFSRKPNIRNAFRKVSVAPLRREGNFIEMALGLPWNRALQRQAKHYLRNQKADIFLDLTEDGLPEIWRSFPGYGTWSITHGDQIRYGGSPCFFWELYEGSSMTGAVLEMTSGHSAERKILFRSNAKTHPYSLFLGRNEACWKASAFVTRCLKDLHTFGWPYVSARAENSRPPADPAMLKSQFPHLFQVIRFLGKVAVNYVADKWEKTSNRYQYFLAYKKKSPTFMESDLTKYQLLRPPISEFWADPFLYRHNGKTYLFFENYLYAEKKGLISYIPLSGDVDYAIPEVALEREYHLSYPFIFNHGDEIYMIPETSMNRTIELYKAVDFPGKWELEKVLMSDIEAHDATLHYDGRRFWLFANVVAVPGGSVNDELYVFYADSLWGNWTPHPKNPVISDVSLARPAGKFFFHHGKLIRPSQDCSKRYGYGLNFNYVEVLTETDYQERLLFKLTPDGFENYKGLHTYNSTDEYEIIDLGKYTPTGKRAAPSAHPAPKIDLPVLEWSLRNARPADNASIS